MDRQQTDASLGGAGSLSPCPAACRPSPRFSISLLQVLFFPTYPLGGCDGGADWGGVKTQPVEQEELGWPEKSPCLVLSCLVWNGLCQSQEMGFPSLPGFCLGIPGCEAPQLKDSHCRQRGPRALASHWHSWVLGELRKRLGHLLAVQAEVAPLFHWPTLSLYFHLHLGSKTA